MTKFNSITMSYSKAEDRIHLALALEGEQFLRMWMTQRLARQLVVTLAEHLEKTEPPQEQGALQPQATPPVAPSESQARQQAQAVARIRPTRPTIPPPDMPVWLINDIRLSLGRSRVGVQFSSNLDVHR